MWRYALPGVAIVGAVIALFVGALTLTGSQETAPGAPTLRAVSDRSVQNAPPSKPPSDAGANNLVDTRLPPPPDLEAAQKAAAEASQALAASQRERQAERALMATQAQPAATASTPPAPPPQTSTEAERQARVQALDQRIAQRHQTLAAVNQSVDQARQTLAGLQQQLTVEQAALNKLKTQDEPALTAERDKLRSQVADLTSQVVQQTEALDATRASVTQTQTTLAALRKKQGQAGNVRQASAPDGSNSFSTVQSIVDGLRKSARDRDLAPPPPPPPPASEPPIQHPAGAGAGSPWRSLMAARQAIATGDPGQARVLLASSQHELRAYLAGADGFAAAQVAEAMSLLDAGAPVRAMHYLDLAIANLSRTPQAAEQP